MLSKQELDNLLKKNSPELFKQSFKDGRDFRANAEAFPEYKDQLIQAVLDNPDLFKHCFENVYDLIDGTKAFPEYKDQLIKTVLGNPDLFKQCFKTVYEFGDGAKAFSEHTDQLIKTVLGNPDLFKHYFSGGYLLDKGAKDFPEYKDQLIQTVLDNPDLFKQCFETVNDLEIDTKAFSEYKDQLIKTVLGNPDLFKHYFKAEFLLDEGAKAFPEYKDQLYCLEKIYNLSPKDLIKEAIDTDNGTLLDKLNTFLQDKYLHNNSDKSVIKVFKNEVVRGIKDSKNIIITQKLETVLASLSNKYISTLKNLCVAFFSGKKEKPDNLLVELKETIDKVNSHANSISKFIKL